MNKVRISLLPILTAGVFAVSAAHAEAPMNVDDAGTLGKGGMKVEGVWQQDDETRGGSLAFGFGPTETLELEVGVSRDRDASASPSVTLRGVGVGAKWVPYQNEIGWSLGARFDYGRTRAEGETEHEYAVTGLASYRFENGQIIHLNAGATHVKVPGDRETLRTWGVGYEYPLAERLQLTAEIFGEQHSGPDKAVGLRYEIFDGFKVSAAIGHGNDREFGQVGFAWEF